MNYKIEKGDWFILANPSALNQLAITENKHYQCKYIDIYEKRDRIFFTDDNEKEDWHYRSQFKKVLSSALSLPPMPDCKPAWQSYDAHQENYECKEPEPENPNNQPTQIITGNFLVTGSTEYITMLPANKETKDSLIKLPYTPYHETTIISIYGKNVNEMSEQQIYNELCSIAEKQDDLKVLNKEAKSSRILGQINALGQARNKIVKYLDELPDSFKLEVQIKTKK